MEVLHVLVMVIAMAVTASRSFAIPHADEHKSRVIDRVSIIQNYLVCMYQV